MDKKWLYCMLIILLLMNCLGCGGASSLKTEEADSESPVMTEESVNTGEALEYYRSFDEIIQNSDVGLTAICTAIESGDGYADFVFSVQKSFWGNTESVIRVRVNCCSVSVTENDEIMYEYETGEESFEIGKEYFVAAEKRSSLIYTYGNIYLINGGLIISVTDQEIWLYGEKQDLGADKLSEDYFVSIYQQVPHETGKEDEAVYADSFSEMWNESEYVVRIRLTDIIYDGSATATNTYYAEVLEQYSGLSINTEENYISVALLKGMAETGEEYIAGISGSTRGDRNTLMFVQETDQSLYPVNDETLSMIKDMQKDSE